MDTPTIRYVLLDGVLCQEQALPSCLAEPARRRALYHDLGAEAAAAGPWLYPVSGEIAEAATTCAQSEALRFAVSFLHSIEDPGIDAIAAHLHRLRYVVPLSRSRPRYFLRYADNRAFSALWDALDGAQRSAVLGPLHGWSWLDPAGQRRIAQSPPPAAPAPVWDDALCLRPPQFKQLVDAGRVGDLLELVMQYFPEQVQDLTLHQRWSGAHAAWRWLQARYRDNAPLCLMVAVVTLVENTRNLAEPDFERAVAAAASAIDPTDLLTWRDQRHTLSKPAQDDTDAPR